MLCGGECVLTASVYVCVFFLASCRSVVLCLPTFIPLSSFMIMTCMQNSHCVVEASEIIHEHEHEHDNHPPTEEKTCSRKDVSSDLSASEAVLCDCRHESALGMDATSIDPRCPQ